VTDWVQINRNDGWFEDVRKVAQAANPAAPTSVAWKSAYRTFVAWYHTTTGNTILLHSATDQWSFDRSSMPGGKVEALFRSEVTGSTFRLGLTADGRYSSQRDDDENGEGTFETALFNAAQEIIGRFELTQLSESL
jgi:hypothetical protein